MVAKAGWYPDPVAPGMSRWWDGARWVDMQLPEDLAPRPPSTGEKVAAVAGLVAKTWFLLLLLAPCLFVIWALLR